MTEPRTIGSFAASQKSRKARTTALSGSMSWECPYCQSDKLEVDGTIQDSNGIYRKRICLDCGARINTHERIINHQKP